MDTLLVIDAGNTHIKWGIYEGPTLRFHWRTPTARTYPELEAALRRLLEHHPLHNQLDGAVISSVVPAVTPLLIDLCRRSLDCDPLVAGTDIETGVSFPYRPVNLGSDRIVNVVAGINLYGFPLIVVDLGTATTLDVVDEEGRFVGGVIFPGIQTAAEALIRRTALPRFTIERPDGIIGRSTVAGLQAGAIYGAAGQVDGLVRHIRREYPHPFRMVATGGFAPLIAPHAGSIHHVHPRLTLDGLRILWEKNRRGGTSR
ncbi:type III pantothenate kinase [Planifilum fimeticola]|jgi:type III pantothenate kinase|uniref:Type III pantothenate kinase n=1 Tax=Planifilum fimeticola TaxID=201975 RepID=A0A2T0LCL9_9BACL|nr:type III pantothenate kinase [Planifilum fimeticola]PRX39735.1 type III pantothenate kinase [Planifilum fimeticola]